MLRKQVHKLEKAAERTMERLQRRAFEDQKQPFPSVNNTAAPDPPPFFADNLRNAPLPTNSAWQNFVLRDGSQPEFIHPYLVQSKQGRLTICYPSRIVQPAFIIQAFVPNFTISCAAGSHVVSHFDDLSVTLDLPGPLIVPLVRGSPYITCIVQGGGLRISSIHAVLDLCSSNHNTKHKIVFNNGQTWLLYSSSSLDLNRDLSVSGPFEGIIRITLLTGEDGGFADAKEQILDRFSSAYPVSGQVDLRTPFRLRYEWKKKGWGDLLMLSHPVHRQILAFPAPNRIISNLSYRSMDGELVGVVGDSWILEETPIAVNWYSMKGFNNREARDRIVEALEQDVCSWQPITTSSTYFYGKAVARVARFALIAEEIHYHDVIPRVRGFLEQALTPWLDGSFQGNAFLYDNKWGGLISREGARDSGADFGFGVYNDHHYHFGYFCYAIAVLAKLNRTWARKFKPHIYSIVNDFMAVNPGQQLFYTRLRNFDLWKLHSWASGITEFADGRNQESSSEALNAYYSASLIGVAYGDTHLMVTGSTLAALEIRSAKALWHVPVNSVVYNSEFVKENRVMGVLWANKRDSGLWFAPADWRECRLGIQLLPIVPVTELLFSDLDFVKDLVEWTLPALNREGVGEGWKGFVHALEGIYDRDYEKVEEAFLYEIEGLEQEKQMLIGSSDEDIDSVAGEFLNLLEEGQNANGIKSGSDSNYPRALLLREFEQNFSLEATHNSIPHLQEEIESSFMDAAELEIQKAEQALRSKARAKILEDAETKALMQEWGLNEKVFEFSPPKSTHLSGISSSMQTVMSPPPLAEGMGSMVQTRDGGYVRSMDPVHFTGSKIDGRLVMHVSKPVVVPAEMGSSAVDILRKMASVGMDNLASQAMMSMPMEDITGKTIQQIASGGSGTLEAPHREAGRFLSSSRGYAPAETGSHLSLFNNDGTILTKGVNPGFMKERFNSGGKSIGLQSTGDSFDDYVSMEDLAPLAIQKIEALALEGLKIQTNMVDEDAPCCVDPMPLVTSDCRSVKKRGSGPETVDGVASMHLLASKHADGSTSEGGIMDAAISLEKWMELHVDVDNEAKTNSDYQCLISTDLGNDYGRRKPNKSRLGCTGGTLTIAMLVQLRDPLRNYESVGAPMIALVQAEQVIKPPRPKLSKQVSMRANAESEEEVEEEKPVEQKQQFKITEVHMAGLKAPEPEKKGWFFQKWGGKKQEQSGSRWLIANGMGKNTKPALLKSKPSSSESKTTVKPGDTLWSISSRVNGTGSKWQEIAALNPHIRNPDIIFANQTIRTK